MRHIERINGIKMDIGSMQTETLHTILGHCALRREEAIADEAKIYAELDSRLAPTQEIPCAEVIQLSFEQPDPLPPQAA